MFILYFSTDSKFANWIVMDEECNNMPLCEFEMEEDDDTEKQSETVEPGTKERDKTSTSDCWRYFTKIGKGNDGKKREKCNSWNKIYVTGGRKYGNSHLNRHVMKFVKRKTEDVSQMILDMRGKLKEKNRSSCTFGIVV